MMKRLGKEKGAELDQDELLDYLRSAEFQVCSQLGHGHTWETHPVLDMVHALQSSPLAFSLLTFLEDGPTALTSVVTGSYSVAGLRGGNCTC